MLVGRTYELRDGDARAVVSELGAGLQRLDSGDWEILDTYPADGYPGPGSYGQVLLPWPNRIAGGRYRFEGVEHQLPLDDLAGGNAIHGLTRWMNWRPVRRGPRSLAMRLALHARPGYPFALLLEEAYALRRTTLRVRTTAWNAGPTAAPVGVGHHPYFRVATGAVDEITLSIPARSRFATDGRGIPRLPPAPVDGTPLDFRVARPIGTSVLDVAFTDLTRDADGEARVVLAAPGGTPWVALALDDGYTCVQVYTGDTLADPARRRRGLAVEPCTCAADAFNNGWGLRVLQPGASLRCAFTIAWAPPPP